MTSPTSSPLRPAAAAAARTAPRIGDRAVVMAAIASWAGLVTIAAVGIARSRDGLGPVDVLVTALLALVVGTIWLGGIRALSFMVMHPALRRRAARAATGTAPIGQRVAILSCSADDFDEHALARSMQQTYPGVTTIVLDDSSDPDVRRRVDAFAARHAVTVIRRTDRTGYKAGNLNHFLRTGQRFDHYAVVDSDEVLPHDFVERALARFAADPRIGVVQGRHRVHTGRSPFADRFGTLLETHVRVTQAARSRFGFSMFMGRGAMISDACIRIVGVFPEMVMEDLAFSVEARRAGFEIAYAPEIVSSEDYPVDYNAFRKQHGKFSQGSIEFLRRYGRTVVRSELRASEKVDLLVDSTAAPAGALLALGSFIATMAAQTMGTESFLPGWVGVTLAVCGLAPLLPEFLRQLVRRGPVRAAVFLGQALALYGSTLWITLRNMARVVVGRRAVFTITPKRRGGGWRTTVLPELVVTVVAATLAVVVSGSVTPAAAFAGVAAGAAFMTVLSTREKRGRGGRIMSVPAATILPSGARQRVSAS